MSTKEIEQLIEKYEEGLTDIKEELALREFFMGGDVPAHLKHYREIFGYFNGQKRETLPGPDFDHAFETKILMATEESPVVAMFPNRGRIAYISSIAAGVLLVVGLFFTFLTGLPEREQEGKTMTYNDTEFDNARQALMLVSVNLNSGLEQVQRLDAFDKAMHNMELFNKFYQYQPININPDK